MRIVLFCHSLASDWNHGNAHFLRGVLAELAARGFAVEAREPANGWSAANLVRDHGASALAAWQAAYPGLATRPYWPDLDLDEALDGAGLVLVHEWTDPALVARIGRHRRAGGRYLLLFHDTHHRAVSDPAALAAYDLSAYDGVLAFGATLAETYRRQGWGRRVFVWHEAADTGRFRPHPEIPRQRDLVWIGNWGDEERSAELAEFLVGPVRDLRLAARVHGVRYPDAGRAALAAAGIEFAGYLPNPAVPRAFAAARCTVHVPRRPYARQLPGIPTIRVFEALACGIPLVSAPWDDVEGLFTPGSDYLVAADGAAMRRQLRLLTGDREAAAALAARGRATVLARHGCRHRVDALLAIAAGLGSPLAPARPEVRQEARQEVRHGALS